jgi:hypothetical protein
MRCTETERLLVIKQLQRAMEEVVRAKLMMQAVASDPEDEESVGDLDCMADSSPVTSMRTSRRTKWTTRKRLMNDPLPRRAAVQPELISATAPGDPG